MTPQEWSIWVAANNRTPEQIAAYPDLEQYDFNVSLDQVEAAGPLRPMPVVVLTASVKFAELWCRRPSTRACCPRTYPATSAP